MYCVLWMRQLQSDSLCSPFHRKVLCFQRKTARLAPLCYAVHLLRRTLLSYYTCCSLIALPIISHVHLHKRWVEREKGISLNSTLMVCIAEIYNDEDNTPYVSDWFFKLHILISFDIGFLNSSNVMALYWMVLVVTYSRR